MYRKVLAVSNNARHENSFLRALVYSSYIYMQKNTMIGFGMLLAILASIVYYATTHPAQPETSSAVPVSATALPAQAPFEEHADYYDIAANYPTTTPLTRISASADASALATMRNALDDMVARFKSDGNFSNLTPEDIKMLGFDQGRKESLTIKYLIASSVNTVSYIYTIYADTLGAHPNGSFRTFTFDTNTGKELAIGDLFASDTYLQTLSTIARAKLPRIIGTEYANPDFINPGTTPEEQNFQNFFLDNKDFVVLFPPYQVGPYALGPQTLRIPVSELKDILKPEFQ